MKHLVVKNWTKLQHQSEKSLPWIKFFTALLAPTKEPAYSELPDQTKCTLHHIWLMARVFNNRIPETWITKEKLNLKSRLNLEPLLDAGYIWFEDESGIRVSHSHARDARSVISNSQPLGPSEGEREGEAWNLEPAFTEFWVDLCANGAPRPLHKERALTVFKRRVTTPDSYNRLKTALANYRSSPRVSRGYVQDAPTWLDDWEQWERATGVVIDTQGLSREEWANMFPGRPYGHVSNCGCPECVKYREDRGENSTAQERRTA
jgi:hypothetical protein